MENVKGILTSTVGGKRMFPTILQDLHDPRQALGKSSQAIYDIYPLSADATRGAYEQGEAESGLDRFLVRAEDLGIPQARHRSEEHTSELQSLMRISYAVFCLKKKTITK